MEEIVQVRADRIAAEGEVVCQTANASKVVFVPHILPGERAEVRILEDKGRFQRGNILKILQPSPSRIEPRCPHHFRPGGGDYCGGCQWQCFDYPAQLKLKREIVIDCVKRIAKLECPVLETAESPEIWRYRNKVQVPFRPSLGGGALSSGFYVPGSHRVVEFQDCVVQSELSVEILNSVRALGEKFGWKPYREPAGGESDGRDQRRRLQSRRWREASPKSKAEGWLRHLYLRTNAAGEALVIFVTRTPDFPKEREASSELLKKHPQIKSLWQNVQEEASSVVLGPRWRKIWGSDRMSEQIGPLRLEFSPGAFLQVNTRAAEVLYRAAENFLIEDGFQPNLLLDLYSGVGAIALWMASRAKRVVGVEEFPQAVKDAYHNARRLKAANAHFIQGKIESTLNGMPGLEGPRPWACIVDPPRSGCEPAVLHFLARHRFDRVIYVSCNPATFARDAQRLAAAGFRLNKIQPVDLFPQTSHVELAAQFIFGPSRQQSPAGGIYTG